MTSSSPVPDLTHRLTRMAGRDRHEKPRAATSLELLFDLTFVVVFSVAGVQLAHFLSEGHYFVAIIGFLLVTNAAILAWLNFSWFASAFDTDDWFYRLVTMVQMVGVLIMALGVKPVFESIQEGHGINLRVVVLGYVVMRISMLAQWIRVAVSAPGYRRTGLSYAIVIAIAQIGWVALAFAQVSILPTLIVAVGLMVVELAGPAVAEYWGKEDETPWHAHHIAERYSLLAIITLGEGIVGTVAALQSAVDAEGWTAETICLGLAGVGITFGMWWVYFAVPFGEALHHQRSKGFLFGYGHFPIFMAIAAVGAGLHVAALYIEHHAHISAMAVLWTVVVPVAVFIGCVLFQYSYLLGFQLSLLVLVVVAFGLMTVAVVLAAQGVSIVIALFVVVAALVLIVAFDELSGWRHRAEVLARLAAD